MMGLSWVESGQITLMRAIKCDRATCLPFRTSETLPSSSRVQPVQTPPQKIQSLFKQEKVLRQYICFNSS